MYRIHLTDDTPAFEAFVKAALYSAGTCDALVAFRHFESVGEAIRHYQTCPDDAPDVALVDLDFTHARLPETERGTLKGLELIGFLSAHHPTAKVFAFTGYGHSDEVAEALDHLQLFDNTIEKGSKVGAQVRVRIWRELQRLAKQKLADLPQNYQNELRHLPDAFADMAVGNTGFSLRQLLAGWGDIAEMPKAEVQRIVHELLEQGTRPVVFNGNWNKPDSAERRALAAYQSLPLPAYEATCKALHRKAFDLLLELIRLNDVYKIAVTDVQLSHAHFYRFSVTQGVQGNPQAFTDKLVGRRALLAFETHIDHRNGLSLDDCAFLLRDTDIHVQRNESWPSPRSNVLNTHLGLSIVSNNILQTGATHCLPEEVDFVQTFGTHAQKFAELLSVRHIPKPLREYLRGDELYNLSELKIFLENLQTHPDASAVQEFRQQFFAQRAWLNIPPAVRQTVFGLYGILP